MLVLKDDEFFEGILGGCGWIIAMYYFKERFKSGNTLVTGFVSWGLLWYIRKVGMNLYRGYKKYRGIDNYVIDLSTWKMIFIGIIFIAAIIYMIIISPKNTLGFSFIDFLLIGVMIFMTILLNFISIKESKPLS